VPDDAGRPQRYQGPDRVVNDPGLVTAGRAESVAGPPAHV